MHITKTIECAKVLNLFSSSQDWPRGSTGVQRYGCIPRSAANNLGEIPKNWELQISCFEEFGVERTFWDSSQLVSLTLWDTPVLFTPPLLLPQQEHPETLGAGGPKRVAPSRPCLTSNRLKRKPPPWHWCSACSTHYCFIDRKAWPMSRV